MGFQGKEFSGAMMQLVVNLKQHYDSEKSSSSFVSTQKPVQRTARGLGIGESTVKRIMALYNKGEKEIVVSEPKDRGRPSYRLAANLQPLIRDYIRQYNLKGQRVGIESVGEFLLTKYQTEISVSTLWRSLKRWGFIHGVGRRRCALKEREAVVVARRKYLRFKRANRNSDGTLKRPEVYLDETYINKNHSSRFTWYLDKDGPWVNKPSGKGPRFIILHAITMDGWVKGAELVFEAKRRTGDYHGQMNWDNFSKWFTCQLLPNIPSNSIIILDNARYHNVLVDGYFPNPASRKQQMRDWLSRNNIPWSEDMLRPELLKLCKRFAPAPEFKLDKIAESLGHTILRTPPYHPELQPIETCWALVKNYMGDHCDFTMENLKKELPVAFSRVKASTCKKLIAKVVRQEIKYWAEDTQIEEIVEDEAGMEFFDSSSSTLLEEGDKDNYEEYEEEEYD